MVREEAKNGHLRELESSNSRIIRQALARLGYPRLLGLAIDWTMFDAALPSGERMRYQVLRIAVPRKGRALPLLQLA